MAGLRATEYVAHFCPIRQSVRQSCATGVSLEKIPRTVMPLVIVTQLDLLIASVSLPLTMWPSALLYR